MKKHTVLDNLIKSHSDIIVVVCDTKDHPDG